jgi:hypothetical protein
MDHDGLAGKSTATDQYPTEQQGISNNQVTANGNSCGGFSRRGVSPR